MSHAVFEKQACIVYHFTDKSNVIRTKFGRLFAHAIGDFINASIGTVAITVCNIARDDIHYLRY